MIMPNSFLKELLFCFMPRWRNWQTHQLQVLALERAWGFDSLPGHHASPSTFAKASVDAVGFGWLTPHEGDIRRRSVLRSFSEGGLAKTDWPSHDWCSLNLEFYLRRELILVEGRNLQHGIALSSDQSHDLECRNIQEWLCRVAGLIQRPRHVLL